MLLFYFIVNILSFSPAKVGTIFLTSCHRDITVIEIFFLSVGEFPFPSSI